MRTLALLTERMAQYKGAEYIYEDFGYIAWQVSTGENVEIIFIEVAEPRKGYATKLLKMMLERIKPYNSIFVFRLKENDTAGHFYRAVGFKEQDVIGLYKGKDAVLGVANYEELCRNLLTK